MSSRSGRGAAIRSYRRRKTVLDFDLNRVPGAGGENREQEGPSTQLGPQQVQADHQQQVVQMPQVVQPATIDVEAIDDDVVESSPRAFAEVYPPFPIYFFSIILSVFLTVVCYKLFLFVHFSFILG